MTGLLIFIMGELILKAINSNESILDICIPVISLTGCLELHPEARIIYTPVEELLRELTGAGVSESEYRSADVLLIDDLQFLGHHSELHQTLFHLLDHLLLAGKQVALACDRPPLELGELDDRLLSRFSGGLVVDIGRPVLDTRRAILELRLGSIGASLRPEVIEAIAPLAAA